VVWWKKEVELFREEVMENAGTAVRVSLCAAFFAVLAVLSCVFVRMEG